MRMGDDGEREGRKRERERKLGKHFSNVNLDWLDWKELARDEDYRVIYWLVFSSILDDEYLFFFFKKLRHWLMLGNAFGTVFLAACIVCRAHVRGGK